MPLIDVTTVERGTLAARRSRRPSSNRTCASLSTRRRVDRIVGVLDTLELLGVDKDEPILPYVKPVDYVAPGESIQDSAARTCARPARR